MENRLDSNSGVVGAIVLFTVSSMIMLGQGRRIAKLEKENSDLHKDKETLKDERDTLIELSAKTEPLASNIKVANEYLSKTKALKKDIEILNNIIKDKNKECFDLRKTINSLEHELSIKPLVQTKEVPVTEIREIIKEVPSIEIKEVVDSKSLQKIEQLENEKNILNSRCNSQNEKIKELRVQLREAEHDLSSVKNQLSDFKSQVKLIIDSKNDESEALKQLSRTVDRVSKKANKYKGGKK